MEGRAEADIPVAKLYEEALATVKPLTQSTDPFLHTYGEIWTANTLLELGDIVEQTSAGLLDLGQHVIETGRISVVRIGDVY